MHGAIPGTCSGKEAVAFSRMPDGFLRGASPSLHHVVDSHGACESEGRCGEAVGYDIGCGAHDKGHPPNYKGHMLAWREAEEAQTERLEHAGTLCAHRSTAKHP